MCALAGGCGVAALPGKLDPDAVVALGGDFLASHANHQRYLGARGDWFRLPVARADRQRAQRAGKAIAVSAGLGAIMPGVVRHAGVN